MPGRTGWAKAGDVLQSRALLCLFEVTLLWCTSLNIALGLVGYFIATPDFSFVVEECSLSAAAVERQQQLYSSCARAQADECTIYLKTATERELTRINRIELENAETIASVQNISYSRYTEYELTVEVLRAWKLANPLVSIIMNSDREGCSTQNVSWVTQLVQDKAATASSIASASMIYSRASDQRIENLVDYSAQLQGYGESYTRDKLENVASSLSNKINQSTVASSAAINATKNKLFVLFAETKDCLDINASADTSCKHGTSAASVYSQLKLEMDIQVLAINNQFAVFDRKFAAIDASVTAAISNANKFYQAVAGAQGVLQWLANNIPGVNLGSELCGRSSPNWCEFSEASWKVHLPDLPSPIPLRSLPSPGIIANKLSSTMFRIEASYKEALNATNARYSEFQRSITQSIKSINITSGDYEPPVYKYAGSVKNESIIQKLSSESFQAQLLTNISDLASSAIRVTDTSVAEAYNFTESKVQSHSQSLFKIVFGPWITDYLSFESVFIILAAFQSFFVIFDYLYRAFRSLSIIRKQCSKVSSAMTVIDMRANTSCLEKLCNGERLCEIPQNVKVVLTIISYTWFYLLMFGLFFVMIVCVLVAVYVPAYRSYTTHCVKHESGRERTIQEGENGTTYSGTFLARNLNSFAFNYAAMSGNNEIASSVSEYNLRSSRDCAKYASMSASRYKVDHQQYADAVRLLRSTTTQSTVLNRCVNTTAMAQLFSVACTGPAFLSSTKYANTTGLVCPTGYNAYPKSSQIDTRPGDEPLSEEGLLRDSNFLCSAIPQCLISCSGPRTDLIQTNVVKCSCIVEWSFHSNIVHFLVVLTVYLVLNLSRFLVCKGVALSFWKSVSFRHYELLASCNSTDGIVDFPGTLDAPSQAVALRNKIHSMENSLVLKGWLFVALGIAVNGLFIYPLIVIRSDIQYIPNHVD